MSLSFTLLVPCCVCDEAIAPSDPLVEVSGDTAHEHCAIEAELVRACCGELLAWDAECPRCTREPEPPVTLDRAEVELLASITRMHTLTGGPGFVYRGKLTRARRLASLGLTVEQSRNAIGERHVPTALGEFAATLGPTRHAANTNRGGW